MFKPGNHNVQNQNHFSVIVQLGGPAQRLMFLYKSWLFFALKERRKSAQGKRVSAPPWVQMKIIGLPCKGNRASARHLLRPLSGRSALWAFDPGRRASRLPWAGMLRPFRPMIMLLICVETSANGPGHPPTERLSTKETAPCANLKPNFIRSKRQGFALCN